MIIEDKIRFIEDCYYENGLKSYQIAKQLGISPGTLSSFCKENNIVLDYGLQRFKIIQRMNLEHLVPISYFQDKKYLKIKCRCDCGNIIDIRYLHLLHKETISCSCWKSLSRFQGYHEISLSYWNRLQFNARKRNLDFDITLEYIWDLFLQQERKCALSGMYIQFDKGSRRKNECTASLDRKDSSIGYITSNVQWVHKDLNFMKQEYNQDYFIQICKMVTQKHE